MSKMLLVCFGLLAPIDGDSGRIRCDDGRAVEYRLADIDAPETGSRAACPAEMEAGRRAARELRAHVSGQPAALFDVRGRRSFGRVVGRVEIDGQDLAETAIARGWAKPWPHDATGRPLTPRPDWCGG